MSPSFRVDDYMKTQVRSLWDVSVGPQTAKTYNVAIQHLLQFVTLCGLYVHKDQLPVISEDILIYFVLSQ